MTTTLYTRGALAIGVFLLAVFALGAHAEERGSLDRPVSNTDERPLERPGIAPTQAERPAAPETRIAPEMVRPVVESRDRQAADRAAQMDMMRPMTDEAMEQRKMQLERERMLLQQRAEEARMRQAEAETLRAERISDAESRAFVQALQPLKRGVAILNAAIERMRTLIDRLDSRIEKLAEMGVDVGEAHAFMARALGELDAASETLRAIQARIDSASEAENPRAVIADVREALRGVHESIRGVQGHLRSAVERLKAQGGE